MKTDNELLKLNDNYTKLGEISDLLEKIESIINKLPIININCENNEIKNRFKYRKELNIEKLLTNILNIKYSIDVEQSLTSCKAKEVYNLNRLGTAIINYKSLSNNK